MTQVRLQIWLSVSLLVLSLLGFASFSYLSRQVLLDRLVEQTVDDNRTIGLSALDLLTQPVFETRGIKEVKSLLQHSADMIELPNDGYICAVNEDGQLLVAPGLNINNSFSIKNSTYTDLDGNSRDFETFFNQDFFQGYFRLSPQQPLDVVVAVSYPRLNIKIMVMQRYALLTGRTDQKLRRLWPVALAFAIGLGLLAYLAVSKQVKSYQKRIDQQQQDLQDALDRVADKSQELMRKNGELEISNQEKDGLMGILAHDMRSPLSKIKGLLDITQRTDDPEEKALYSGMIFDIIGNAESLVNDILETSSIESGEMQVRKEPIQVRDFLDQATIPLEDSAEAKNINIVTELPEAHFTVETDPHILNRIMDNLLSNAIKYTSPGKSVYLTASMEATGLHIQVKDEGQGIKEEEKHLLFRKFQKLSNQPTAKESSTGLGLYIVKLLAEQIHATLWVESEYTKGATFHVRLAK